VFRLLRDAITRAPSAFGHALAALDLYLAPPRELAVIGTPDDAIRRIERIREKQGEFGALLLLAHNWADWAQTQRSYELYARYVIPHFSGANAARFSSYEWVTEKQSELVEKRVAAAQAMFAKHEAERASADG
jgi:limonene 1,2-monooxygenase